MVTLDIQINPKCLECSVCLDTVDDPRVLPCGHTFCGLKSPRKCLQSLDPENTGTINCPNCQAEHYVRVTDVPLDTKCKHILHSLKSNKQGTRMCRRHNKEIVMICMTDGDEICLACIGSSHCGHRVEGLHNEEQRQLSDFWNKENEKLEDLLLQSMTRKRLFREEAVYLENQRLQEESRETQLDNLITRRRAITSKLASTNFNPDDNDLMALKEYMNQLKATSDHQQEASEVVRERSQQLIELVDSRSPTFCQNIYSNPVPPATRPTPSPEMIPGPSTRPTGVAQLPATTPRGIRSRQYVGRRTLPEENVNCTTNILALGMEGKEYILRLNDNRWEQWEGKRENLEWGIGAVCYQKKVYIIGGFRDEITSKVDIFSIRESTWTEGPELNIARRSAAACFVESEGSIYICGGSESVSVENAISTVEVLELDGNGSPVGEWKEAKPMKEERDGCAAVAVGNRLFVTGGKAQNREDLSSVEIFDTETDEWNYGPQMTKCRSYHAVEHHDGSIYAIGGYNGDDRIESCEKLDLQIWAWTTIESMRVPRAVFGSVVVDGKIFVVGGYTKENEEDDESSVQIYDPVTKKWSRGPQLPESLVDTKCVSW